VHADWGRVTSGVRLVECGVEWHALLRRRRDGGQHLARQAHAGGVLTDFNRRCATRKKTVEAGASSESLLKWAWVELNYRPHAYQACALTT
jgi:hypothetical protein